jgi:anti-sigma regulatory factor (Ser/Thr protein kinase)
LCNAGHAAPLLAVDGTVGPLEISHKGVLLGVRGRGIRGLPTYKEQVLTLPPGSALVLYTDGLTDRRSHPDGAGHYTEAEATAMLRDAVLAVAGAADLERPLGGGLADAIALAAQHAVPGDIDDDMAILVMRSSPTELAVREDAFPAEPIMVSEARKLAAATFTAWEMDPDQADLACLLVSEVVTNAVLHASITPSRNRGALLQMMAAGGGAGFDPDAGFGLAADAGTGAAADAGSGAAADLPEGMPAHHSGRSRKFRLRLRRGAESVWIEVFDPDLRLPRIRTAGATDEGGRGLYLVEQLATRWGSRPTPEGKAVWFEVPLDGKSGLLGRVAGAEGHAQNDEDGDGDPPPVLALD